MTLINTDSFAHYTAVTLKYSSTSTAVITGGVGRGGRAGIVTNGSTFFADELKLYDQSLRLSGVVHGISFQPLALAAKTVLQYQQDDGTVQATIALDAAGHLLAYRGTRSGGTLLETSTETLVVGTKYYIESKVFIDDIAGTIEVRVWSDADSQDTFIDFTGDTRNAGTGLISTISYGITADSPSANWGDKYTCDLVGSAFNDFLGNKQILALFPAAAGDTTSWIPTPGVANYLNVANNPPDSAQFNTAPDVSLDTIPTIDLLAMQAPIDAVVNAVVENVCVSGLPQVEVVEAGEPTAFGPLEDPLTTTSTDTLTGNLIIASLMVSVDDALNPTPVQTDWTLLSHQRVAIVDSNPTNLYNHYMLFWRLAAGDGAVQYDFTEAVSSFALSARTSYITNIVLRNQHASWEFDLVEAAEDSPDPFTVPFVGGVNTIETTGTAAPDSFGHLNLLLGFGFWDRGGNPTYGLTPSFGHDYTIYDNGSSGGTNTGLFAFALRSVNGDTSPSLTVDFNAGNLPGGVRGAMAVSLDIKPRTSPPGVADFLVGARLKQGASTTTSFGIVPLNTASIKQFPFETAPDAGAWSQAKLDATQAGYANSQSVDVDPAPTMTLTVASANPTSGVAITVSPDDNNGSDNGTTPFARDYNIDTAVMLTAPSTAGANAFSKWTRDGSDYSVDETTSLFMDDDHLMTAVYLGTCSTGDLILLMDGALLTPQADGSEITSWVEDGVDGYTFIPVGGGVTGPLYDTTPADNIRYGTWDAVTPITRGLKCVGPVSAEIGLPNAFTLIAVVRVQAVDAGFPFASDLFVVNEAGIGWSLSLESFGTNFSVEMEVFGQTGDGSGGGISSGLIFDKTVENKFLLSVVCDGTQVRMLINGQQLAAKEWFNNNDFSNIYTPSGTTTAALLNAGFLNNAFYGRMPYLGISNTNLSDADRQTIEAAQVTEYGVVGYIAGACDVACVPA